MSDPIPQVHMRAVLYGDGAKGYALQVRKCVEFPRITQTATREKAGAPFVVVYSVDGLEGEFSTFSDAYRAMRAGEAEPQELPHG